MGKSKIKSKYVIISGLALNDNNRGTAALGYGALSFLQERGFLSEGTRIRVIKSKGRHLRKKREITDSTDKLTITGTEWVVERYYVNFLEWGLMSRLGILIPFTKLWRLVKNVECVAAINGGDGFSDIYGTRVFHNRLGMTKLAMAAGIPLILLPQTIGPFSEKKNLSLATKILKYAKQVFVRDDCFIDNLKSMGVRHELTNDLSYYMKPEPFDINIDSARAIGINVSGLAWDNEFHALAGQFDIYPELIMKLITMFQKKGNMVYLIPHSYNYNKPERYNDDLKAAREVYNRLEDKSNVVLIDGNLSSPQVKYVISKMSFFVGTRMHANYAAIFSKVPLYGLAYSYKFKGAFENNGIYNRTSEITNISESDIDHILSKIEKAYREDVIHC